MVAVKATMVLVALVRLGEVRMLESQTIHRPGATEEQLLFGGISFTADEEVSVWHVRDMHDPIRLPQSHKNGFNRLKQR